MNDKKLMLRFNRFKEIAEVHNLGEYSIKIGSGKTPRGGSEVYQNEGILLIRSQNVLNGELDLSEVAYISEKINNTMINSEVSVNDVLLNITGASIGRCAIVPNSFPKANVNQHVCIIRVDDSKIVPQYVMQQILSPRIQNQINSFQAGGNREGLNFQQIRGFNFLVHEINEQQKIADFLSTLDARIALQFEKVNTLQDLKKGYIQKIFSQEIRFKREDGSEYPQWSEKKLGEIAKIIKSSGLSKSDLSTRGVPCILYGELYTRYSEIIKVVLSKTEKKIESAIQSRYGDVIIPSSGETPEDIATASCVLEEGVMYGGDLNIIRSSEFDGRFLSYQLNHPKRFEIATLAQGATVSHLYGKALSNLQIITADIEEQEKIADFLATLDSKIDIETQILSTLQTLKKGLLQQMFV